MSVYRDPRTGLWRVDFRWRGRRLTRKGYRSANAARQAEYDWRKELALLSTEPFPIFRALVNAWLESGEEKKSAKHLQQARQQLERAFGHLAEIPPKEIQRAHIEPVLVRMARTRKPNTVNNYRRDISAVFNYALKLNAIPFNPVRGIERWPVEKRLKAAIPTAHLQQIILAAPPEWAAGLIFISQTACRSVELSRLEWPLVQELNGRWVAFLSSRKHRGGEHRLRPQPLTATALAAIETMRGVHPRWVFPGPYGGRLGWSTMRWRLHELCAKCGLPRYGLHQIRHWGASVAARSGKNIRAIADLLGHTDTANTERYIHALSDEVWAMAEALERELNLAPAGGETKGGLADA